MKERTDWFGVTQTHYRSGRGREVELRDDGWWAQASVTGRSRLRGPLSCLTAAMEAADEMHAGIRRAADAR